MISFYRLPIDAISSLRGFRILNATCSYLFTHPRAIRTLCILEAQVAHKCAPRYRIASASATPVAQDFAGRIVTGRSGHAAARVGTSATHIETRQRPTIVGVAQCGPGREQLI
jgi:hypothetical protein